MFRLGYNTNGLAHHRPADALRLIAGLGYEALALTPDPGCLDPFDLRASELNDVRRWAEDLGLALVVETGSRFLLDAERKHFPTLLEESAMDRGRRLDFLKRCCDMAAALDAEVLSIWSGAAPDGVVGDWPMGAAAKGERGCKLDAPSAMSGATKDTDEASKGKLAASCEAAKLSQGSEGVTGRQLDGAREVAWQRLTEGTRELLDFAAGSSVQLAFEPEPGMFVATPVGYGELVERLGAAGDGLGLTLDVGHCLVTGDDVAATIHHWAPRLVNVHLDDIKDRHHDHRMFGEGDLDLSAALRALIAVDFDGIAAVELSRDSYRGPVAAREAMGHLRAAL